MSSMPLWTPAWKSSSMYNNVGGTFEGNTPFWVVWHDLDPTKYLSHRSSFCSSNHWYQSITHLGICLYTMKWIAYDVTQSSSSASFLKIFWHLALSLIVPVTLIQILDCLSTQKDKVCIMLFLIDMVPFIERRTTQKENLIKRVSWNRQRQRVDTGCLYAQRADLTYAMSRL